MNDPVAVKNDEDLNHLYRKGPDYIYKHTNPQIRIHYQYDFASDEIIIYNYYFITGDTVHKKYEQYFDEEFNNLKNRELYPIGISTTSF